MSFVGSATVLFLQPNLNLCVKIVWMLMDVLERQLLFIYDVYWYCTLSEARLLFISYYLKTGTDFRPLM